MLIASCKKEDNPPKNGGEDPIEENYDKSLVFDLTDIAYGSDSQQIMDVYLPANRDENTKVFVLIHGGGWNAGSKADMGFMYETLKLYYPNHAIVNMGYRLATLSSPGYPKQIQDIDLALAEIKKAKYGVSDEVFLLGGSAGGHLAMLYGYAFDEANRVKGIANTVGPADFTDPSYTNDPAFEYALIYFVGPETYVENPSLWAEASPVTHISSSSPKTISFYGSADPLVPATQMDRLHDKLDAFGVVNEKTMYDGEGHGDWSEANANDFGIKLLQFINTHYNY